MSGLEESRRRAIEEATRIMTNHFDAVVILGSNYDGEEEGTNFSFRSKGNIYATDGMARQFVRQGFDPVDDTG